MDESRTDRAEAGHVVNAPFGVKADGSPKRGPGGRPPGTTKASSRPGNSRPSSTRPPTAPPAPTPRKATSTKRGSTDYRPGLTGLFHVAATPMLMQNKNLPLKLDGMALLMMGEELAEGFNHLAQLRPEVAAACDKLIQVGPYGAILAPVMKFAAQVVENHGLAPVQVTRAMGAVSREELEARLVQQAQAAAERQAQAAAYVADVTQTGDEHEAQQAV